MRSLGRRTGDMGIWERRHLICCSLRRKPRSQNRDVGHPVSVAEVRHAVMLEADLGSAVRRAFAGTLGEARMRLFHPLGFMLASPVDSPEEAVERFTNVREAGSGETDADGPRI